MELARRWLLYSHARHTRCDFEKRGAFSSRIVVAGHQRRSIRENGGQSGVARNDVILAKVAELVSSNDGAFNLLKRHEKRVGDSHTINIKANFSLPYLSVLFDKMDSDCAKK